MIYARLNPLDPTRVRDVIDIEPERYAALAGNPKQALLRPLVTDPQPTVLPTQRIDAGPIVIEPTQARRTWVVRDATAEELASDADENERLSLLTLEAFFDSPAPTTLVGAVADIQRLKRVCKWLLRRVAQA